MDRARLGPVVSTKWRSWKAGQIVNVAAGNPGEGVTHRHRIAYFAAAYKDGIAIDPRLRRLKSVVLPGTLKPQQRFAAFRFQASIGVLKSNADFISLDVHRLVNR